MSRPLCQIPVKGPVDIRGWTQWCRCEYGRELDDFRQYSKPQRLRNNVDTQNRHSCSKTPNNSIDNELLTPTLSVRIRGEKASEIKRCGGLTWKLKDPFSGLVDDVE